MAKRTGISRRLTATLAIICFLPPLLLFVAYAAVGIRYGTMSKNDRIATLLEPFPSWLQNYTAMTIISLILCIAAVALASRSYKKKLLSTRVLMLMVVLISIFLILFNISQLL